VNNVASHTITITGVGGCLYVANRDEASELVTALLVSGFIGVAVNGLPVAPTYNYGEITGYEIVEAR
jgi:hypothetical protein